MEKNPVKIALAHDYLREFGGAERVLEALHQIFPEAPVYVAFTDKKAMGKDWQRFRDWDIRETKLRFFPFYKKLFSPMRIFAPWAFRNLDLSSFDLVISSSNAYFAKAVHLPNGKQYCYCHTPPRVLYGYSAKSNWKNHPVSRFFGEILNHFLRPIDFDISQKVDKFIANSKETQRRIRKFYHRDSQIIHPPVKAVDQSREYFKDFTETDWQKYAGSKKNSYYLYVNRLALAKHPEIAVQVAKELDLPLKVVGSGVMLEELKDMAGEKTEFLGAVGDEELAELYRGARALLYPVEDEDFGMVPIEAMTWGTPVFAHFSGGPKETILEGKTGFFFSELSSSSLINCLKESPLKSLKVQLIHQAMRNYSFLTFKQNLLKLLEKELKKN